MKILIMGAGSIGSVFGGFLAEGGHDVTLVGRPAHMTAIEREGLRIGGIWGDHHVTGLRTVTSCDQLARETFELVMLSVKSYDTKQAIEEAVPLVAPKALVLSLQNGLGNVEIVADAVGVERTLGGMVIFGAHVDEPGRVTVTVYANEVKVGSPTGVVDPARVDKIAALIDSSGIPTLGTDEIEKHIWAKVLYNCALNPLSAVLNATYGELAEEPGTRRIMDMVVEETFSVADARGVELMWDKPAGFLELFYEHLVPPTAGHYASMLDDLKRGKRTEIDALNGAIVGYGKELNVECPVNEVLSGLVRVLEQVYGKGSHAAQA